MGIRFESVLLDDVRLHCEISGESGQPLLLVHGGPGLHGYMRGLAEQLSTSHVVWDYFQRGGQLSPHQTPVTVDAHVKDLSRLLALMNVRGAKPILLAHSWGALLSLLTLAQQPHLAKSLILVGPMPLTLEDIGVFAKNIDDRLTPDEREERAQRMTELLGLPVGPEKNNLFLQMGDAIFKTYQKTTSEASSLSLYLAECDAQAFFDTHVSLAGMLSQEKIVTRFAHLPLPVRMIYGDTDPSPCEAIARSLDGTIKNFQAMKITNCGHYPWWEEASVRKEFFDLLGRTLAE
jgi:pimeloyl-ACP methyl ester carboxylesterase